MKKLILTVCLTGILSFGVAVAAFAQKDHEEHHPQAAGEPAAAPQPMGVMDRPFFLDRAKELGLSDEPVRKLGRSAEPPVRNVQKLQGDMKVRFLKAKKDAEKVLTPEQLKMARGGEAELEGLFR